MALSSHSGGRAILMTFVVALVLTIAPLPDWADSLRPEWVALALLYWCLALPQRIGVGIAWTLGIAMDVLRGALLGQHALALAVIAYLAISVSESTPCGSRPFPYSCWWPCIKCWCCG